MNSNVEFYLRQRISHFQSEVSSALSRIRGAKTMRDVKFAADLHPDALVRHAHEVTQGKRRVQLASTDRMNEMLDLQLAEMRKLPTAQEMKEMRGNLLMQHWPYLRGAYAQVYVRADRTSQGLIYAREKTESAESESDQAGEAPGP